MTPIIFDLFTRFEKHLVKRLPGQDFIVHGSVVVFFPSHWPPFASFTVFDLIFVLLPFPHQVEHSPICHALHSQTIGVAKF